MNDKAFFFCGIGGSGMLPLAAILKGMGADVSGSDRSRDQGRLAAKFNKLEDQGFALFPQDGSGLKAGQTLIASAAIEDSVPDIAAANQLGLTRKTRAQCLSELFNAATKPIGIAGTSGKSTTTGMVAHILSVCGLDPVVMNGADMINLRDDGAPIASARIGQGAAFVSEIDESDGSIAFYNPNIAVLNNVAEDHKPIEELRALFAAFLQRATHRVINADHSEVTSLAQNLDNITAYSLAPDHPTADLICSPIKTLPHHNGSQFQVTYRGTDKPYDASTQLPGRHNVANAMAALSVAQICGIPPAAAVSALASFKGIARRFEVVGRHSDITLIDDFGHNPDKISATFQTLRSESGRLLVMFQPHGFGPLRLMKDGFIDAFSQGLRAGDYLIMPEPVYYGGTTDRSVSTRHIVNGVIANGKAAEGFDTRAACGQRIIDLVQAGDRIIIMGARDDTLTEFAKALFLEIQQKFP